MTKSSSGPNGSAPDSSGVALIIIDMINDLEFDGGETLLPAALAASRQIAGLKQRAGQFDIPVIYANDNFGRWRSNFPEIVEHCLQPGVRGRPVAEQLKPAADDYFVLKPKHSGFYATPLELLLAHLGCRNLILCGMSGNMCVQFTACDAYMRNFKLFVPEDCTACATKEDNRQSLDYMCQVLNADITMSDKLNLEQLRKYSFK